MTLQESLALLPVGCRLITRAEWAPFQPCGKAEADLFVDGERVAGVVSEPYDQEAFESALVQIIRSRFDASYDECEWQPRAAGGREHE